MVLDPKISSKETEDLEEIVGIATLPVLVLLSAAAALDEDARAPDPDGPCAEDDWEDAKGSELTGMPDDVTALDPCAGAAELEADVLAAGAGVGALEDD